MTLQISIDATNRLQLADPLAQAAEVDARNAAGEAVVTQLQDHFLKKNAQPNARNWPKRGFWAQVLQALGTNQTPDSYDVTVASPAFWRRWKGGAPITPKAAMP
jgi:hypothetical protein